MLRIKPGSKERPGSVLTKSRVRVAWPKRDAGGKEQSDVLMIDTVDQVRVGKAVAEAVFLGALRAKTPTPTPTSISAIMEIIFCSNLLFALISVPFRSAPKLTKMTKKAELASQLLNNTKDIQEL